MALPEDVPEEQTVVCGNKVGTFLTRMQRVVLDGVEMSASRFEQVGCGLSGHALVVHITVRPGRSCV